MPNSKEQAHELIERLAPSQVTVVVSLLETMLDPVSRAIANAPNDDEPEDPDERRAVSQSKDWLQKKGGRGISEEAVLADFHLDTTDLHAAMDLRPPVDLQRRKNRK